jgi:hypothetical protein
VNAKPGYPVDDKVVFVGLPVEIPPGYYGPGGYRPVTSRVVPKPMPTDQNVLRQRRRRRLPVVYGRSFDLGNEVREMTEGLAVRAAALPPGLCSVVRDELTGQRRTVAAFRPQVDELAAAVAELVGVVAELLGERDAARKTAHLEGTERAQARRALAELAAEPQVPQITDDDVRLGDWPAVLVRYVAPLGALLGELLGAALPPEADGLNGRQSVSERLVEGLRPLDRAAAEFDRVLTQAFKDRRAGRFAPRPDAVAARKADAVDTLQRLGVAP